MESSITMKSTPGMEKLRIAIGSITINFQVLELVLSSHVARLVSDDSVIGAIITCEMSFRNLLTLFDSLTKHKITDAEQLRHIADLVKRLDEAEQDRNRIIHSVYVFNEEGSEVTRIKATARRKQGLRFAKEKIDTKPLAGIVPKQAELVTELESLYRNLYGEEIISYG